MLRLASDADVHGVVSRALEGWADDPPTLEPMEVGHEAAATAAQEEANRKRSFVSVLDVLPEGTSARVGGLVPMLHAIRVTHRFASAVCAGA